MERFATNFRTHFLCFCYTFCIAIYFTNNDNNFSTSFYSFHCSSFLMFIKRNCVIETFVHFSIKICIRFSSIIFLIFHFFEFGCLFVFLLLYYICAFLLMFTCLLYVYKDCSSGFVHVHNNINKDATFKWFMVTFLSLVFIFESLV